MSVLCTDHLTKTYSTKRALVDCSITIPRGSVVALVGPNGAGKTTLLEIATGLTAPTSGTLTILDDYEPGSPEALEKVAFVAQEAPLYRSMSTSALLTFTAALNPTFDRSFALKRLASVGVPLARRVGRLSGGQQAQVALTLALARRPELLILDEPVSSLDPLARQEFLGYLMKEAVTSQMSVIFSSHSLTELERIADFLVLIVNGEVQLIGSLDAITEHHRVVVCSPGELDGREDVEIIDRQLAVRFGSHVVRVDDVESLGGLDHRPTSLEAVVLSYLRRAQDIRALEEIGQL